MPLTSGTVRIFGHNLATEVKAVRSLLGVVFQHPGLDDKLTVVEEFKAPRASLWTRWQKPLQPPDFGTA